MCRYRPCSRGMTSPSQLPPRLPGHRVGEHDRGVYEAELADLERALKPSAAVEVEIRALDRLLEQVLAVRENGCDAGSNGARSCAEGAAPLDDRAVPHLDSRHVGEHVLR